MAVRSKGKKCDVKSRKWKSLHFLLFLLYNLLLMEIQPAGLRDLGPLRRLEHVCFDKDAWPIFDLIAVLTWPEVIRLKAVEDGDLIGFVAGDPRPSQGYAWIATIGVDPGYQRRGIGRALLRACEKQIDQPRVRLTTRQISTVRIVMNE